MKATEGHSDYRVWPPMVWKCMQEVTEDKYLDPTFEVEDHAEEADDTSLNEATTQNAN